MLDVDSNGMQLVKLSRKSVSDGNIAVGLDDTMAVEWLYEWLCRHVQDERALISAKNCAHSVRQI